MAIYPIRKFPDPVLAMQAATVTTFDADLARLAEDMLATMYEAPGVGLAAPQIGISKRVFVADIGDGPFVMVNPRIVETSGSWKFEEGCLSVPDIFADVDRPATCRVRYQDLEGETHEEELEGLMATCLQHEMDHLEGILFIDHLSRLKRNMALKKLKKLRQAA